ncbi:MAG: hypothetical protein QF886_10495, partial [Planctomycetota bacterium]|nr:hypothetical protein [Planctomycetota bacterium]
PIAQNARVYMRSWGNDSEGRHLLQHSYATLFSNLGCTTTTPDLGDSAKESYLDIEGENAFSLASFEVGTHLFILKDAQFHPVQVEVLPHDDEDARDGVETHEQTHHKWLQQLYDGEATLAEDPFPVRPVIRIYDLTQNITMDLRTALLTTRPLKPEDLRLFMISSLPLSKELVC